MWPVRGLRIPKFTSCIPPELKWSTHSDFKNKKLQNNKIKKKISKSCEVHILHGVFRHKTQRSGGLLNSLIRGKTSTRPIVEPKIEDEPPLIINICIEPKEQSKLRGNAKHCRAVETGSRPLLQLNVIFCSASTISRKDCPVYVSYHALFDQQLWPEPPFVTILFVISESELA